jgi:two-component system, chemotaxis family, protein-glutamate methylesterase/glutaminase
VSGARRISVLVIDDSPVARRSLTQLLESAAGVEVVGRAGDGEEGLKLAHLLRPEVITLDLEMPRLDGFGFLRLLRASLDLPVVVVSSYAHRADVFKALELGAVDFVPKPARGQGELEAIRHELLEKIHAASQIRLARRPGRERQSACATRLVLVGASTGGPAAIQRLIEALRPDAGLALVVAVHMPARFTRAFAERLDGRGGWRVREARHGEALLGGAAWIAPGGAHLVLGGEAARPKAAVVEASAAEKHVPSVNRLLESGARLLGAQAMGLILTGMGSDGAQGALAIHQAGGEVWAESEDSALIFGMPREAILTGAARRVMPLGEMGPALERWAGLV